MSLQLNPDMILAGSMGEHRLAKDQAAGQGIATKGDRAYSLPISHAQVGTQVQMEIITAFRFLWESRLPLTDVESTYYEMVQLIR